MFNHPTVPGNGISLLVFDHCLSVVLDRMNKRAILKGGDPCSFALFRQFLGCSDNFFYCDE